MEYADIPYPACIAFGLLSDPVWQTAITTNIGGFDAANQDWEDALHRYDVSFAVRTASDYQDIRAHFHQVRGRAKKFPFKDWLDFQVSAAQGVLIDTLDGLQMHRRYGSGTHAYDRKITRPRTGTVAIFRTRGVSTTNATADATISYTTGLVVMANHESDDDYTWSGEFLVPCRYDTDRLPGLVVNKSGAELLVQCDSIIVVEVRE